MLDTIAIAAIIAVFTALIAYYEHQLVRLTEQRDSALDELENRNDLSHEPPFNLLLSDPVLLDAFRLRAADTRVFSQAEINGWN